MFRISGPSGTKMLYAQSLVAKQGKSLGRTGKTPIVQSENDKIPIQIVCSCQKLRTKVHSVQFLSMLRNRLLTPN